MGFTNSAIFVASGVAEAAAQNKCGRRQRADWGCRAALPHPFVVAVTDAQHNRLANVPVTFTVKQGGGNFGGQTTTTTNTDSDGRALAVLTLGPQDGIENNVSRRRSPATGERLDIGFESDGADGLSNLVDAAAGKPTARVLDWFHISIRLRPIEQMSSKIAMAAGESDAESKELLTVKVPRIRYQLWNGKREAALERIEAVYRATKRHLESCLIRKTGFQRRLHKIRRQAQAVLSWI